MNNDKRNDRRVIDVPSFEKNVEILEHVLLLACIKSYRFYANIRDRLCPRLPDGRSFRPDFTNPDYNRVHNLVAHFWEGMANMIKDGEMGIGADLMEVILSKEVQRGIITAEQGSAIAAWLSPDLRTVDLDLLMLNQMPSNPTFLKWIEGRAIEYEHRRLQFTSLGRQPTLSDLQDSVKSVQKTVMPPSSQVVNPGDLLWGINPYRRLLTVPSLPELNDMLKGGFAPGETTVIGGISGGAKTLFAMQATLDFARSGRNVVVLTTEQKPAALVQRMVSNHFNLDYSVFKRRIEKALKESPVDEVGLRYLPEACYDTPEKYDLAIAFQEMIDRHVRFIDWSGTGMSLVKNFDAAIEQVTMSNPGWEPEVIIVDWVGGGLDHSVGRNDQLRHFYRDAGETIINHGKRTNRVMFIMAQLNKTLVKCSTSFITQDMLAECKSLIDNATNFMGITALRSSKPEADNFNLQPNQYFCFPKIRDGETGRIKVTTEFHYQRFIPARVLMQSAPRN